MIAAFRFVEPIMQNAIVKDVVSGLVTILSRLLHALKERRDFLSIDPKVREAELTLAELHQCLLVKEENHGLSASEEVWLQETRQYFDKHRARIEPEKIKLAIMMARIADREYISPISNKPLNGGIASMAQRAIQKSLDKSRK